MLFFQRLPSMGRFAPGKTGQFQPTRSGGDRRLPSAGSGRWEDPDGSDPETELLVDFIQVPRQVRMELVRNSAPPFEAAMNRVPSKNIRPRKSGWCPLVDFWGRKRANSLGVVLRLRQQKHLGKPGDVEKDQDIQLSV